MSGISVFAFSLLSFSWVSIIVESIFTIVIASVVKISVVAIIYVFALISIVVSKLSETISSSSILIVSSFVSLIVSVVKLSLATFDRASDWSLVLFLANAVFSAHSATCYRTITPAFFFGLLNLFILLINFFQYILQIVLTFVIIILLLVWLLGSKDKRQSCILNWVHNTLVSGINKTLAYVLINDCLCFLWQMKTHWDISRVKWSLNWFVESIRLAWIRTGFWLGDWLIHDIIRHILFLLNSWHIFCVLFFEKPVISSIAKILIIVSPEIWSIFIFSAIKIVSLPFVSTIKMASFSFVASVSVSEVSSLCEVALTSTIISIKPSIEIINFKIVFIPSSIVAIPGSTSFRLPILRSSVPGISWSSYV